MAATQVARNNSFNGFDEFLNLPASPSVTPRLPAAKPIQAPVAPAGPTTSSMASTASGTPSAFNMRKVGLDENQPPPPPGSSPEALFRYYLAAELRKAGTRPDEALLDRYVKNHFDSLFKNKQQAAAPAATGRAVAGPSVPIRAPVSLPVAEPIALQRLPIPRKAPVAAPVAGPSSQHVAATQFDACSPPELQEPDSPSLSGKSFSPLPTPPALSTMDEADDEELDFVKAFGKQEASAFEVDPVNSFDFVTSSNIDRQAFRSSAFRMGPEDSVSIDPHMVQLGSASPFGDLLGKSSTDPSAATAMSEDGLSDHEDQDTKETMVGAFRHPQFQQQQAQHQSPQPDAVPSAFTMFRPPRLGADSSFEATPTPPATVASNPSSKLSAAAKDLKPDPEEYKKLSSKEKRQLRNKISARNFRTRRKEYIGHLEEQVADRDSIIEGLRQQLSQVTMEKMSLQEEVRILKAKTISQNDVSKILEVLQKNLSPINTTLAMPAAPNGQPGASPPLPNSIDYGAMAPLTPSAFLNFADGSRPSTPTNVGANGACTGAVPGSPRSSSPRPSLLRRSSPSLIGQPNTMKDVGPQSSFWGGVGSANGQSFTPVC
ncbi:hypothetical protein ACQY0O_005095 [Thecaphora frezii]